MSDKPKKRKGTSLPDMPLMERERFLLDKIYAYDGFLAFSHIKRLFGVSDAQVYRIMKRLIDLGLVQQLSREQRRFSDQPVYWLTRSGAQWIALQIGVALSDLSWREAPRFTMLPHDFAVTDFRMDMVFACERLEHVVLQEWIPELVFRSSPDRITYTNGKGERKQRNIIPDGYCILRVFGKGTDKLKRYIIEIDRRTEDNPRFGEEKILPGMAYLNSDEYKQRFGLDKRRGHYLVVTTGERRMENMLAQARKLNGDRFLFTTFDQVSPDTVLTKPIWHVMARRGLAATALVDTE